MFCFLSREGAKFSNNNSGEGWWTEYNYSSRSTAVLHTIISAVPGYCPFANKWGVVFVDPLSPNLRTEGNFQARFSQRKSIGF
jgi:hypothetical protein